MKRVLQSSWFWSVVLALIWVEVVLEAYVSYRRHPTAGLDHPAILRPARYAVVFWWGGAAMALIPPETWRVRSPQRMLAQEMWLLGWLMLLVHVVGAFHIGHEWSHAAAYAHTEQTAGVGAGIFVNYLFVLVWGADVVWFVASPGSYARRPRWVGWAVHGFLAFVVFNATVAYGTGFIRWTGVILFALLGWYSIRWWRTGDRDLACTKGASGNSQE